MEIADCYRLLGLNVGASLAEIKASYRRLARQYHPDIRPTDTTTKEKFIALTEAYKLLISLVQPTEINAQLEQETTIGYQNMAASQRQREAKVTRKAEEIPPLSLLEQQLKWRTYQQLQQLWRQQRFPKAIVVVEGLAKRLPQDPQVRQWQGTTYQRWGRQLLNQKQIEKARVYLKKALKTDPHNRSLWFEVERDFRQMEKFYR